MKNFLVFSLLVLLMPLSSWAHGIKGYAQVEIKKGRKHFQFEQIIIINADGSHFFEVIDDFGNSIWSLRGLDQKKLKKLGFKINLEDFINVFRYQHSGFVKLSDNSGRIIGVKPKSKKQRWEASFDEFKSLKDKEYFPWLITIKSPKTELIIRWIHLDII